MTYNLNILNSSIDEKEIFHVDERLDKASVFYGQKHSSILPRILNKVKLILLLMSVFFFFVPKESLNVLAFRGKKF